MNLTYDYDSIYKAWVTESYNLFSKWSDSDFFSNKAEHVYFYEDVSDESVNTLSYILNDLSKTHINNGEILSPPKPIVIHLNSRGGSTLSENMFNVMITSIRVPMCIIIETKCMSAATTIGLLAPYRLMIDYSSYLIHDSAGGSMGKVNDQLVSEFTYSYQTIINYISLLKKRTKLSDDDIKHFISRDIQLDSKYCKDKGIVDRILKFPPIKTAKDYNTSVYTDLKLSLPTLLKKTNVNHIYIDSNELYKSGFIYNGSVYPFVINGKNIPLSDAKTSSDLCVALDQVLMDKTQIIKPIMIHFRPSVAFYLYTICNPLELISLQYRIALIQKKTPVYALIEGPQALDNLGTILMCPIRLMLTPSIISSYFTYESTGSSGSGMKTIDVVYNTNYILAEISRFLKQFSHLPLKFYKELPEKIINLKPNDSLKYEIINQVIHFTNIKPVTMNNIKDYYQLDSLTENYNNDSKKKSIKSKVKSKAKSKAKSKKAKVKSAKKV